MLHSKTFKDYLQEYALIVVGSVIYAAGFRFFYYPNDIKNLSRYRVRSLPAAGALLRDEDRGEKQLSLLEE